MIAERLYLGDVFIPEVRAALAWRPDENVHRPGWHEEEGRVRQVLYAREAVYKLYCCEYGRLGLPRLKTLEDREEVNETRQAVWKEVLPQHKGEHGWFDPLQWRPKLEILDPWALFAVTEAMVTQEAALRSVGVSDMALVARALEINEKDPGRPRDGGRAR